MKTENNSMTRRSLLSAATGIVAVAAVPKLAKAVPTPTTTEGPFYPTSSMRFADIDNDLVKIQGEVEMAGGEVVHLKGRVLKPWKEPVAAARVEIWQCDVNGKYLHPDDSGGAARDPAFQGFGHFVTGDDGAYSFRTIKPVAYAGRTPHIHVKVFSGNRELTTQFYLRDDPGNRRDWLYNRLSEAQRKAVEMDFQPGTNGPEAHIDIVI